MRISTRRLAPWLLYATSLCGFAGCSAIVHTDEGSLGPAPVLCSPGAQIACPCASGPGVQTCNTGGSFDPCVCGPGQGTAGAGGH